jgi:transposase
MRRIRQVLQLHFGAQASARVIAREVGVGRSTVQDYLARAGAAGLGWPLAPDLTDAAIEQRLFPAPSCKSGARRYPEPDWGALAREMKRPGVSGNTVHFAIRIAAVKSIRTVGSGVRGRSG